MMILMVHHAADMLSSRKFLPAFQGRPVSRQRSIVVADRLHPHARNSCYAIHTGGDLQSYRWIDTFIECYLHLSLPSPRLTFASAYLSVRPPLAFCLPQKNHTHTHINLYQTNFSFHVVSSLRTSDAAASCKTQCRLDVCSCSVSFFCRKML